MEEDQERRMASSMGYDVQNRGGIAMMMQRLKRSWGKVKGLVHAR